MNPGAAAVPMEKGDSWGKAVQVSGGGFFFTPKFYLLTIPVTDAPAKRRGGEEAVRVLV